MREVCYGVIPLRREEGKWQVLLIQHRKGLYWAFPKGHAEPGEAPKVAAERELREETGLTIKRLLLAETLYEAYSFKRRDQAVEKQVFYYLAEVEGVVSLQASEIASGRWVPLSEAPSQITYPDSRAICEKAILICSSL